MTTHVDFRHHEPSAWHPVGPIDHESDSVMTGPVMALFRNLANVPGHPDLSGIMLVWGDGSTTEFRATPPPRGSELGATVVADLPHGYRGPIGGSCRTCSETLDHPIHHDASA